MRSRISWSILWCGLVLWDWSNDNRWRWCVCLYSCLIIHSCYCFLCHSQFGTVQNFPQSSRTIVGIFKVGVSIFSGVLFMGDSSFLLLFYKKFSNIFLFSNYLGLYLCFETRFFLNQIQPYSGVLKSTIATFWNSISSK